MTSDGDDFLLQADRFEETGDLGSAFNSLLVGAEANFSGCQLNLANFYAQGKGTPKSYDRSAFWYKRAYRNGLPDAALNLAIDHRNQGNTRSAVSWFRKAIAMGDGEACLQLAQLYLARKRNLPEAGELLRQAVSSDYISEESREESQAILEHRNERATP